MADTRSILTPLLGAVFKSPLVLILTLCSLTLTLITLGFGVSILGTIGMFVFALMTGADPASEVCLFLGMMTFLVVVSLFFLKFTRSTWASTLAMARHVRDETNQAREAVVSILGTIGLFVSVLMTGADPVSEVCSFLGMMTFLVVVSLFFLKFTRSTWATTLAMARHVRDETNQAREAVDQRAERRAKIEAQGGQISVAPEAGAQGRLTQVEGREGLELVEGDDDEDAPHGSTPTPRPGDL